jgi:hypothetical protein
LLPYIERAGFRGGVQAFLELYAGLPLILGDNFSQPDVPLPLEMYQDDQNVKPDLPNIE